MANPKSVQHQAAAYAKHAKYGKEGAQNAARATYNSIHAKLAREIEEQTGVTPTDWQVKQAYKARMVQSIANARRYRSKPNKIERVISATNESHTLPTTNSDTYTELAITF